MSLTTQSLAFESDPMLGLRNGLLLSLGLWAAGTFLVLAALKGC